MSTLNSDIQTRSISLFAPPQTSTAGPFIPTPTTPFFSYPFTTLPLSRPHPTPSLPPLPRHLSAHTPTPFRQVPKPSRHFCTVVFPDSPAPFHHHHPTPPVPTPLTPVARTSESSCSAALADTPSKPVLSCPLLTNTTYRTGTFPFVFWGLLCCGSDHYRVSM